MSTASTHRPPGRTDAEFVKRLADHYAPSPLSPGQRAAWDVALAARLEKRRRAMVLPGLATAALAAALVFGLGGWFGLERSGPSVRPAPTRSDLYLVSVLRPALRAGAPEAPAAVPQVRRQ